MRRFYLKKVYRIAPCKAIGIAESGRNVCLWNPKTWALALESGIRLKESGIQVSLTTNPESSTCNLESTA